MATVDADRNLLFALLAFQNGLIDQDQLVAAFRAKSRDKGCQIADELVDRGDLNTDQRGVIEAMVGMHLKKHGGSAEKSLAAIPAGRSVCERLGLLANPSDETTLGHLGTGLGHTEPGADSEIDHPATRSVGSATSEGQRFRAAPACQGGTRRGLRRPRQRATP